ncbi:hypothetical protein C8250_033965 [Streptomyces sp. So13.3]|uniref:DUF6585 family protein n=1 Tax=Streptomyces TaxID=1883 RepID=UPI0011070A20|nr:MULTISPECIES: DUF6585 family protein [Streptomyces]MCZ4102852.1 hypothetical protein [Streptomyces sp. H39-C1]QNA76220.1 hypothetical protein C8250_033965 [Streptomyces sp. So13.3]
MGAYRWIRAAADARASNGIAVSCSARTFDTKDEARAHLQDHLDSRAGGDDDHALAAERLRSLPPYAGIVVGIPGMSWRITYTGYDLKIFSVDRQGVVSWVTTRPPSSPSAAPGSTNGHRIPEEAGAPSEVVKIAEQHQLGRFDDAFTVEWFISLRPTRPKVRIYAFESGVVRHQADTEPQVFRWDQIATVSQSVVNRFTNGRYKGTSFRYALTRTDGAQIHFLGSYKDSAYARRADPNHWARRYNQLGQRANQRVSQLLLPSAVEALRRGDSLAFGKIAISADGIQSKTGLVPWADISSVSADNGYVTINGAGTFWSLFSKPVSEVPNVPLLMTLADMCRRNTEAGP